MLKRCGLDLMTAIATNHNGFRKIFLTVGLLAAVAISAPAWAALPYTSIMYSNGSGGHGTSDTSGGMTAINALVGVLSYSVDQLQNGNWKYTYTVTPATANKNRGIGSFHVQFGELPTDLTYTYTYNGSATATMSSLSSVILTPLQTIDRTLAGSSMYDSWLDAANKDATRVNVTTTYQGLSWIIQTSNPNGSNYVILELTTSLAPMWGNIYMDGYNVTTNNGYGFMRNTSYDTTSPSTFSLSAAPVEGKIPVPGSHMLALSFSGTGGGSVNSAIGFTCTSGAACDPFIAKAGTPYSLTPTPDANSVFAGWSGACTNSAGNCDITADANKVLTAMFNIVDLIRIGSTPYTTLATAFQHGADGQIKARAVTFTEPAVEVTMAGSDFDGGYDTAFASNSGTYTTLNGAMTVSSGSLTVAGLAIY